MYQNLPGFILQATIFNCQLYLDVCTEWSVYGPRHYMYSNVPEFQISVHFTLEQAHKNGHHFNQEAIFFFLNLDLFYELHSKQAIAY